MVPMLVTRRGGLRHNHQGGVAAAGAAAGCCPSAGIPSAVLIIGGMYCAFHLRRYSNSHGTVTLSIAFSPYACPCASAPALSIATTSAESGVMNRL